MIRFDVNAEQVADELQARTDGIMNAIDASLWRGAEELARELRRNAPKAFSHLVNSINVRRDGLGEFSVESGMLYARMADRGTGPGGSPTDQTILDWIRVKGITPNDPRMTQEDLVFLIFRKIRSRGTPATHYASRSLANTKGRIFDLVRSAAQRAAT